MTATAIRRWALLVLACAMALLTIPGTATAGSAAKFTAPTNGQTGVSTSKPVAWTKAAGAQGYYLTLGTAVGANDLLASGELPASQLSYNVPVQLPSGRKVHARLYTKLAGAYSVYKDISYTTATTKATFTSPTDGQTAVDPTKPMTWNTVTSGQGYYLTIGTSAGANDLLASGELPASQASYSVPVQLPASSTLHARLYTKLDGAYSAYQDISFTTKAPPSAPALAPLTVSGNRILADGQPFEFHGVNRDSLEWGANNWMGCAGDGEFTDADFDNMKAWRMTAIRLPLSQANWLGRRCDAASYKQYVDAAVGKASARGMYIILDLHWSDVQGRSPCDAPCWTGQQPMPDADSLVFWQQVAARYANQPGVIFDLYNEPHDVSWACWRDGGCTSQSSVYANGGTQVSYTVVGMQQLVDVIRAQGASNLVLAAGLDWAYDLSGVSAGYALSGPNIAYDTHVYTVWHSTTADWDQHFGNLAATRPVVATEFGSNDCSTTITSPLLDYFRAKGMSWTIWSWNAPGSCQQPSVLSDMNGTPLPGQGQLIFDTLATLAG